MQPSLENAANSNMTTLPDDVLDNNTNLLLSGRDNTPNADDSVC